MALYFDSEVIFTNAYYGLGKITVETKTAGMEIQGILVEKGEVRVYHIPLYNSQDEWYILREYNNILHEKLTEIYKTTNKIPLKSELKYFVIDWREGKELTELIDLYGNITKQKVEEVRNRYIRFPEVIKSMDEANKELREKMLESQNILIKRC